MVVPHSNQPEPQTRARSPDENTQASRHPLTGTSAPASPNSQATPEQIDRYKVRSRLGAGAFGQVYLAFDPVIKREVAVKIPGRPEGWSDREEDDFLEEARRAARLRHPHIVTIYDAGKCPKHGVFIVMEYVKGQTLAEYLKRQTIGVDTCVRFIIQAADAVHEAHTDTKGLVHRDLKPSNIMLDERGNIRVTDFGLAMSEECQASERGLISGTLRYMSPEQISGQAHFLDGRSDIWSLGVVLYECLTGRLPFTSEGFAELREEILEREPKPLRQINDRIPKRLEAICLKCLSKSISDRFPTSHDLADALRESAIEVESSRDSDSSPLSSARTQEDQEAPSATGLGTVGWTPAAMIATVVAAICAVTFWFAGGGASEPPETDRPNGHPITSASPPVEQPSTPATVPAQIVHDVAVMTHPAGARVVAYPLEQRYGLPDGGLRIAATERSPATLQLAPGRYLVAVALDDGRFHEVYRTVPENKHGLPHKSYAHTRWLTRVDGTVEWPEVDIPPADIVEGMGLFAGSPRFQVGDSASSKTPKHTRFVAGFHLDPHETTWGEFLAHNENQAPASLRRLGDQLPDDDMPIAGIWYDDALMYAEKAGKRLPTETEYEYAATAGGTRRFPWGDDADILKEWSFGPAGTPKFDRVDAGRPVFGLYSNVAEWTCSWASVYPPRLDYQPAFPPRPEGSYIVRGGPLSVIERNPVPAQFVAGPRYRLAQHEKALQPGLGFRCARSVRPRLEATDLERFVRD